MAVSQKAQSLSFHSHQTALAIILPSHLTTEIDRLRAAYDKNWTTWPAHITLACPFVHPDLLDTALSLLESAFSEAPWEPLHLILGEAGYFANKYRSTVHLRPEDNEGLQQLRQRINSILSQSNHDSFIPHVTVGQAGPTNTELRDSLLLKVGLLPKIEWPVHEIAIMIRDEDRKMKVWRTVRLSARGRSCDDLIKSHTGIQSVPELNQGCSTVQSSSDIVSVSRVSQEATYRFDPSACLWKALDVVPQIRTRQNTTTSITVSSYNVLIDSLFPPPRERFAILLDTIRSSRAAADVLLLQEVSDDFLTYLLSNDDIRQQYPYTTHAPSDQVDVGPLLSLRNVVILSRRSFIWEFVPFERRHKGAVLIRLPHIGVEGDDGKSYPLVIAGVHLTCGLTDGSVAAKQSQIRTLTRHLSAKYPSSPWIIAGDFNINTSKQMVVDAVNSHSITMETVRTLNSIESTISDAGFIDSWEVTGSEENTMAEEGCPDGEQGATFDPLRNPLAAQIVGHGSHHRPQRYDRILVRGKDVLQPVRFNMFGIPEQVESRESTCGSDHWGVRATFSVVSSRHLELDTAASLSLVNYASGINAQSLLKFIANNVLNPTSDEVTRRKQIFEILRTCLSQISNAENRVSMVVVPVGSYGLNVWNTASDIDCLCIGSISSKTFFTLAIQRLRASSEQGIRILRKVGAHTGTMLEIEVQDVRADVQYCCATRIAETWPTPLSLSSSDPIFSLSHQALSKLKAVRDMAALQETIPNFPAFQLAYRYIVIWAVGRGLYAARFGFLGGLHISMLLNRIIKLLYRQSHDKVDTFTAADIVCAFFRYYATFDWKKHAVEDPDIQQTQGRRPHTRHFGEAMVITGFNAPNTNIARQATIPAVRTLEQELQRADHIIITQLKAQSGIDWERILHDDGRDAVTEFLTSYNSYIRIDVQFWGLSKGRELLGWIESRFPALLVDLNRRFPEIHGRIWPARFTRDQSSCDSSTIESTAAKEFQGCYLVGLTKTQEHRATNQSTEDKRVVANKLTDMLDKFAVNIRENNQYFNVNIAWVDVSHVKHTDLGALRVDNRAWGSDIFEADLSEFDEEEEEDLPIDEFERLELTTMSKVKPTSRSTSRPTTSSPLVKGKRLRPAADVISRIRWDPSLDSTDFIVGYLDRFTGAKEIALDRWKDEQTDEEFIPQHRIMYFRRKSDGVKIWDREARLDNLFGGYKPWY